MQSSPHPQLLELVTVYPSPRPNAGRLGMAVPALSGQCLPAGEPLQPGPLARGSHLTHARAGSGSSGVAPTHVWLLCNRMPLLQTEPGAGEGVEG